jgi:GNAT superfamily N-acetyltransferase
VTTTPELAVRDRIDYRPVQPSELETCAELWRLSTNDYIGRLNQPLLTETAPVVRLYGHLQSTDPERFVVATQGDRIVGFASAAVREQLWFLSMCFVLPEVQGRGIGRALLERIAPSDPAIARATATDSAQPISNALYASLGIVPREPLLNFIGTPTAPEGFGTLPSGVTPVDFERVAEGGDDARLMAAVEALDRRTLSVGHPADHRWLRREGRRGFLYHGPDGSPIGYGYASEAGRVGPVASLDPDLIAPILGHLTSAIVPRGAFALWLPGTAGRAIVGALQAGFRLEPFPVLLCWDRSFADLARYLPISPGLL